MYLERVRSFSMADDPFHPGQAADGNSGEDVVERQHGVRLAEAGLRFQNDDGITTFSGQAQLGTRDQLLQGFDQHSHAAEGDSIAEFIWSLSQERRPKVRAPMVLCRRIRRRSIADRKSTRLNSSHRCISYA